MASQFKQDNPGCDCCGFECEDCDGVTYFTISGLTSSDCSVCDTLNGTYVFRTAGDPVGDCAWTQDELVNDNCGGSTHYVGVPPGCSTTAASWEIEFLDDPGGVKIRVRFSLGYQMTDGMGTLVGRKRYRATWEDVFASCADAIGQTLPLVDTLIANCGTTQTFTVVDICDLFSATVTLG